MLELWLVPPKHTDGLNTLVNGGNKALGNLFIFSWYAIICTAAERNCKMSALVSGLVWQDYQTWCNYAPLVTGKLLYCVSV